jgi:non-ribosomal peptide synthetase component F
MLLLLLLLLLCCCMLQAGGCYVPLDPGFPADRLSIYLEDSNALALITEPAQAQLAMSLVAGLPLNPQVSFPQTLDQVQSRH